VGVTSIFVAAVAGCIGVLVSLALFHLGPSALRNMFFLPGGAWRRFGRLGWMAAMVALVLMVLVVTPRYAG